MNYKNQAEMNDIKTLIDTYFKKVDSTKSFIYDLGTPVLEQIEGKEKILQHGTKILPILVSNLNSNTSKNIAYTLDLLKQLKLNPEIEKTIFSLKTDLEKMENKKDWDYVVIGQCNSILESKNR
jgi:hypothetical protein